MPRQFENDWCSPFCANQSSWRRRMNWNRQLREHATLTERTFLWQERDFLLDRETVLNLFESFWQNLKINCRVPLENSRWFSCSFFLFSLVLSSEHSAITIWQFYVFRYVCSRLWVSTVSLNASSVTRKTGREKKFKWPCKIFGHKAPLFGAILAPLFWAAIFLSLLFSRHVRTKRKKECSLSV